MSITDDLMEANATHTPSRPSKSTPLPWDYTITPVNVVIYGGEYNAHQELLAIVRRLAHFSGCYDNGTETGEPMDFVDYRLNLEVLKDEAFKAIAKATGE